ncbi:hypothetical protein, partial [Acinetobacter baumannii]|uniref:hypothetical protein n=1 Tax=Acinetobacter baumannii TaxID=470 RepID=UPI003F679314
MATTLYHTPNTAAFVVHWLLIELDVPHELQPLDFERGEHTSSQYLVINPAGVVPRWYWMGTCSPRRRPPRCSWPICIHRRRWHPRPAHPNARRTTRGCSSAPIPCSRHPAPGSIRAN